MYLVVVTGTEGGKRMGYGEYHLPVVHLHERGAGIPRVIGRQSPACTQQGSTAGQGSRAAKPSDLPLPVGVIVDSHLSIEY